MLKLQNIIKDYKVADYKVHALKGVSMSFRKNEFVSVLGPSGCGKTTLLNIIGGLDKYTSGDLFINGVSTKKFGDREWDVYRNHRIGFVFQSYNLIPHQTVLSNVELALTIAGMSKAERTQKAKAALEMVGLTSEVYKRPNQLSGGQSQRVAIARALVNDPEILLADEPTGALDTETSKQILDLIQNIAKERLVIMVTHNGELAQKYSTRIIRLLDGKLISDTNPFTEKEEAEESAKFAEAEKAEEAKEKPVKKEKAKMSFFTAFKLSLNNLFSKKSRTIMTSVAGSIGIIGVSLVLAFSYGIQGYIGNMQNDMLSGNPIRITQTAFDLSSMGNRDDIVRDNIRPKDGERWINVNSMIASLSKGANIQVQNEITPEYIKYVQEAVDRKYAVSTHLDYGLDVTNNIYTNFRVGEKTPEDNISLSTIRNNYTWLLTQVPGYSQYAEFVTSLTDVFQPLPVNKDYIDSQYKLLEGKIATEKNEVMIVVSDQRELNDLLLAQLGYLTQDEFIEIARKGIQQEYNDDVLRKSYIYEDLMGKEFTWYNNDTVFNIVDLVQELVSLTGMPEATIKAMLPKSIPTSYLTYNPQVTNDFGFDEEKDVKLKVVGILEPNKNLSYGTLSSGFYYTQALVEHIRKVNVDSEIVDYYKNFPVPGKEKPGTTAFTSSDLMPRYRFKLEGEFDIQKFPGGIRPNDDTAEYKYLVDLFEAYDFSTIPIIPDRDEDFVSGFGGSISTMGAMMSVIMSMMPGGAGGDSAKVYMLSLQELGGVDIPVSISIYSNDFEEKQLLLKYLDKWNSDEDITLLDGITVIKAKGATEDENRKPIKYNDMLSMVINMINQLIDMITVALIGFTSLALVVSCVMIGIITYVSVVERTKEIGVIRSLGGRKRDVSYLFNAETFIIGLASGLIGIGFTYFASAIINLIVRPIIHFNIAVFPWFYAVIMVSVSIILTLISGLIPSRSAAKKDPVVALRTE